MSTANSTTNPGSVYYCTLSSGTLSGNITLNGTLIMTAGLLNDTGATITITPKPGYPALIVNNNLNFSGLGKSLTVNGVCWIGGNISSSLLSGGTLNVNGSLMLGSSNPTINTSLGTVKLNVAWPTSASTIDPPTPDVLYTPELCDSNAFPKYVKIVSTSSIPTH